MKEMDMKKDFLKNIIKEMMNNGGKSLKKVTVMAKDQEGLKKGLEKAEDMLGQELESKEEEYSCEDCKDEGCASCEEEEMDLSKLSREELEKMLKEKMMK